jgi:hypothetical protein
VSGYYVLDGHTPRPAADVLEMARGLGPVEERRVAETHVGPVLVSTVFLGIDHAFGRGRPLLFETMIFGSHHPDLDGYQERYSDWDSAERGHQAAVALVTERLRADV